MYYPQSKRANGNDLHLPADEPCSATHVISVYPNLLSLPALQSTPLHLNSIQVPQPTGAHSSSRSSPRPNHIMPSHQRQTVDALIRAYNTANIATIRTLFTKSCVFRKLPKSLSIKPYNYDVFIEHTRNSLEQFTQYQVIANEITEDTQAGRIVVRQITTTGTPGVAASFLQETIWTFSFDEAGAKVVELTEFMGREPGY